MGFTDSFSSVGSLGLQAQKREISAAKDLVKGWQGFGEGRIQYAQTPDGFCQPE